jgi:hypothetical protein
MMDFDPVGRAGLEIEHILNGSYRDVIECR